MPGSANSPPPRSRRYVPYAASRSTVQCAVLPESLGWLPLPSGGLRLERRGMSERKEAEKVAYLESANLLCEIVAGVPEITLTPEWMKKGVDLIAQALTKARQEQNAEKQGFLRKHYDNCILGTKCCVKGFLDPGDNNG